MFGSKQPLVLTGGWGGAGRGGGGGDSSILILPKQVGFRKCHTYQVTRVATSYTLELLSRIETPMCCTVVLQLFHFGRTGQAGGGEGRGSVFYMPHMFNGLCLLINCMISISLVSCPSEFSQLPPIFLLENSFVFPRPALGPIFFRHSIVNSILSFLYGTVAFDMACDYHRGQL